MFSTVTVVSVALLLAPTRRGPTVAQRVLAYCAGRP